MSKGKILVTGGAGFIGSHLADALLRAGYDVRILDKLSKPTHKAIPPWLPREAEFLRGDVGNPQDVGKALDGVVGVFHQAAVGGFTGDIMEIARSNIYGTAVLLDRIGKQRNSVQRIVLASSVAVYGEGSYVCPAHGRVHPPMRSPEALSQGKWEQSCTVCAWPLRYVPLSESKPASPETIYAVSKYAQERMTLACARDLGLHCTALRYFLTYGPRQSLLNPYTGICSIFSSQLINDKPPRVFEDGQQVRDFVYVEDVVKANLTVFDDPRANGKVFNVGTGRATSVRQLTGILGTLLGKDIPPAVDGEYRLGEVRHLVADISQIQSLGFQPTFSIEDGLKRTIAWVHAQDNIVDYFSQVYKRLCQGKVIFRAHPEPVPR